MRGGGSSGGAEANKKPLAPAAPPKRGRKKDREIKTATKFRSMVVMISLTFQ